MNGLRRIAGLTFAMLSVGLIDACHKKPAPQPQPVAAPVGPNADSMARAREDSIRRAREAELAQRRADSIRAAEEAANAAAGAAAAMRTTLTTMIHFDYDKSDIRPEDQAILDSKIPILQANPDVRLQIAGNTDERGSDEYNLALGQRRAAAAKQYLVNHGISDSRLETISYGEERPIAQGSDESAWSQNRRDEFTITAGGQMLRRP